MKLYSLMNEAHVLLGNRSHDLPGALREMVATLGDAIEPHTLDEVTQALTERERQYPTLIAEGVYVPHIRLDQLSGFWLLLMVPDTPIPHIVEGQPDATILFMILAPQNKNSMMLQTLAALARLLKSRKTLQQLHHTKSPSRMIRLVEESGVDVKKTLVASDVMTPITHTLQLDMVLARALDVMVVSPDDGLPVLNEHGHLVGELTSMELINLGMPKYVGVLVNPAMLEQFEPFEKFFQHENRMKVREICRREFLAVEPSTPIVHVTHQMVTQRQRRVYVVEDGEPLGIIYRKNIVNKVLHF